MSGRLAHDRSSMEKDDFLLKYGHLRPGTYDILSPRYDKSPELYFDWENPPSSPDSSSPFSVTLPQMREVTKLLESRIRAESRWFVRFLGGRHRVARICKISVYP